MPATPSEAEAILSLCGEYLPPDRLRELLRRLEEGVGERSGNWSLRETLTMFRATLTMFRATLTMFRAMAGG